MNKTLFVDFDGVFHPVGLTVPLHWRQVDVGTRFFITEITAPFVKYCKKHSVDLVVSSAWRMDFSIDDFNQVFDGLVKGVTPVDDLVSLTKPNRWLDIQKYIHNNAINNYAIIDDQRKLFPDETKNLVITNGQTGLHHKDLLQAHKYLNKSK